jgi:diguanylate cyclase (GGDEF)-like protein/PAS domain S-box-containing protein
MTTLVRFEEPTEARFPTRQLMTTPVRLTAIAALAAGYLAAAKFGFTMAFAAEQVTLVWPPTGIALSVLLLFGRDLWPGILLGAFIANVTSHEPVLVAAAIAGGNTLEAVIAASLLRRYARVSDSIDTLRQALGLVVCGAIASTMVSATIGMASLCLGGVQPWSAFGSLWWTWWLGDATGDLLIAPVCLTWRVWPRRWRAVRALEGATLAAGLAVTSAGVFAGRFTGGAAGHYSLEYFVFPFLIWAAIRFGVAGAALANLLTSAVAIWGTVHGFGPYAAGDVADRLMLLQVFMAVASTTALLLGAAITEHTAALRRRDAEHAVTRVLADAASAEEARSRILDVINTDLDWDVGLWWTVDRTAQLLWCAEVRHRASAGFAEFECLSRTRMFRPGEVLPGHVWAYSAPRWIADVRQELGVPRLQTAAAEGLRSAFAFPITVGHEVLGVLEFWSRTTQRRNDDLLWVFWAIGAEIGQFVARKRVEVEIQESEARKAGMLEAALDCIVTIDHDGRILEFNPAAERTFGYRKDEVLGRELAKVIIPEAARDQFRTGLARLRAGGRARGVGHRVEMVGRRANGSEFPVEISIAQVPSAAGLMLTGFIRDITQQKRMVKQLAFRASHDGLTKVLNRAAFIDAVKDAAARAREHEGALIAVLFIDLDRFKAMNDSRGHAAGDAVLLETARRLRRSVRPGDRVARLGGDEFGILLERIAGEGDAAAVAERITDALDQPFAIDGEALTLSASIGIAVSDMSGSRPDDLLRAADAAMYREKKVRTSELRPAP